MGEDAVERPGDAIEIEGVGHRHHCSEPAAAARPEEAVELVFDRAAAPRLLGLERAKRSEPALVGDDPLDGRSAEGADQLVLEIRVAHVEAKPLEVGAREVRAEAGSLERAPDDGLLAGVAEARKPDVQPVWAEELEEVPDGLCPADRNDGHAFGIEVSATPPGQRLERDLVADALDEHDHAGLDAGCDRAGGGEKWGVSWSLRLFHAVHVSSEKFWLT